MDPTALFSHSPLAHPLTQPPSTSLIRSRHPFVLRSSHGPRHAHLLRLYNLLLHLLTLPPSRVTTTRTLRAWRALAACREIELDALWALGAKILDRREGGADEEQPGARRVEWLRASQDSKVDQEHKFVELSLGLIAVGQPRQALEELDAPYSDSIQLHVLAGLLTLYLAQPTRAEDDADSSEDSDSSTSTSRTARSSNRQSSVKTHDRGQNGSDGGPVTRVTESDLTPYLSTLASHSPQRFSQAKEYFRRAAELEGEQALSSRGEGQRWLNRLQAVDDSNGRKRSRSLSP